MAAPRLLSHGTSDFASLGVPQTLVDVLTSTGVVTPFPIQSATLPDSLAGRDVLGRGRTGSGKTYAFLLPLLARLASSRGKRVAGRPRALILAPTRELATQIERAVTPLASAVRLTSTTVIGGVSASKQIRALRDGADIVVACPGRLEDLIRGGHVSLAGVEITVLDEADHMADLGFLPSVKRLLEQTPRNGQRLLFSATLDRGVDGLVRQFLRSPVTHSVDASEEQVSTAEHEVVQVTREGRLAVLVELLSGGQAVVFTRTKHGAKRLTRDLSARGISAVELHGNLAQNARDKNLAAFSSGSAAALVATDIAARGIHVDDVALVIHADPPADHKAYLHRSGRTARAGNGGTVITLATPDQLSTVRTLAKAAGIVPTYRRMTAEDRPIVAGERSLVAAEPERHRAPRRPQGDSRRGGPRQANARQGGGGSRQASGGRKPAAPKKAAAKPTGQAHSAASFSAGRRSARP